MDIARQTVAGHDEDATSQDKPCVPGSIVGTEHVASNKKPGDLLGGILSPPFHPSNTTWVCGYGRVPGIHRAVVLRGGA